MKHRHEIMNAYYEDKKIRYAVKSNLEAGNWWILDGDPIWDFHHYVYEIVPETNQWDPTGRNYLLDGDFEVHPACAQLQSYMLAGTTRDTKDQASELARKLRVLARLSAWADEHGYSVSNDTRTVKHIIRQEKDETYMFCTEYGVKSGYEVYFTKEGARATVEALNTGILVL